MLGPATQFYRNRFTSFRTILLLNRYIFFYCTENSFIDRPTLIPSCIFVTLKLKLKAHIDVHSDAMGGGGGVICNSHTIMMCVSKMRKTLFMHMAANNFIIMLTTACTVSFMSGCFKRGI